MAFVPTDFADVTARKVYLGALANAAAIKKSPLLMSGFVMDARNSPLTQYVPQPGIVRFPVFNYAPVSYQLPLDGSSINSSVPATLTYADAAIARRIVPYEYMPMATGESVIGTAAFLRLVAETIGGVLSNDIEAALMTAAIAEATTAGRVYVAPGVITYADVVKACTTHFGASWTPSDCAMFVSPTVYGQLLVDANVVKAQTSSIADLSGRPLPALLGMPIIPTDFAAVDVSDTPDTWSSVIVRRDSLKSYIGDVTQSDEVHIPGSGTQHIDYYSTYAVHVGAGYNTGSLVIDSAGPA